MDESNQGASAQARQTHDQQPAWTLPGLPVLTGTLAICAVGIALTAIGGSGADQSSAWSCW